MFKMYPPPTVNANYNYIFKSNGKKNKKAYLLAT